MKRIFKNRYVILGICSLTIFVLLGARLFYMQGLAGDEYFVQSQATMKKEIRLTGNRGNILDSNGIPLAYNKTSYDVQFVRDPSKRKTEDLAEYTRIISRTIDIVEENGGKTVNSFAIRQNDQGQFVFDWGDVSEDTAAKREKLFRQNMGMTKGNPAPDAIFQKLCETYQIPEGTSYEKTVKILSVWQEVLYSAYRSYIPVTVATDVNMNTVAEIETYAYELQGMQVTQSVVRVYPKKESAAHIVGYMGKMLDEQTIQEKEEMGYSGEDLVGISGIEASMEYELTGNSSNRTGSRTVEVNYRGKVVNELERVDPKAGNNVVLTIDSRLQKVVEDALADNIQMINAQQNQDYLANKAEKDQQLKDAGRSELMTAQTGAAVVMDVRNGNVLAMASYPSFDPNMFTGGLSEEDSKALLEDKRNPLFNNAISSRGTPGSIFKLVTGLAGLEEGTITVDTRISDQGHFNEGLKEGAEGPVCWVYPYIGDKHQNQTIVEGLKNSCNYFFYKVAYDLRIDKLYKWAELLGLTTTTGIQLPGEQPSQIANQQALYDPSKGPTGTSYLVYQKIREMLVNTCQKANLTFEDEVYDNETIKLMNLIQEEGTHGPDIRALLKNDLKLTQDQISAAQQDSGMSLDSAISLDLSQITWDSTDTIYAGIGQSVTMLTPIGVARYVSAIVNGGDVYDASLVKSIVTPEGEVREQQPELVRKLNIPEEYLQAIKQGMAGVVSPEDGGTAADAFADFKYQPQIGGKTGTAQVSDIDIEDNAWMVAFAPLENPKIVVVVYIPHGYKSLYVAPTIKATIQYYMDGAETNIQDNLLSGTNALTEG